MMTSSGNESLRHLADCQTPEFGAVSVHGATCTDDGCLCDTVNLKVTAGGEQKALTLTADGTLLDDELRPAEDRWGGVVRAASQAPGFQEGFDTLVTQRRAQVLEAMGRLEGAFEVQLPESLLGEGADLERDILGRVELDGQRYAWRIELCADPGCECENLFLVVWLPGEPKRAVFAITADGRWMVEQAGNAALTMDAVEGALVATEAFQALLGQMRVERILQKYHRSLRGPSVV
ncbi:hypothetical protein D7X30_21285 [Corallococcus sp. AB011P]|uniref:hypothetical protein n=1 Tax=Corallococcus sp. AB011P TaxID=2316735 RepID=UPI000EA2A308|nr:hypothetical protein [Corallococcus sp. AB011P]RKG56694.1 hypothetical protein D7X30_21285 [Corallococcus sp. AB011P]